MKPLRCLVALSVLLASPAWAATPVATYALELPVGYAGPVEFEFGEDVSTATGTFAAFTGTGTALFTIKDLEGGSTTTRLRCVLTAQDTAAPGSYRMRVVRILNGVVYPSYGTLTLKGFAVP